MFQDVVKVTDALKLALRRGGRLLHEWTREDEGSVVEVKGWVSLVMRERGKIVPGSRREGFNIWTNTGKEFLALLMSIETPPTTSFREDRNAYIGVGTGTQLEQAGVLALASPVAYASGQFLAALDVPPTFPLAPTRTTVEYSRTFAENEITLSPATTVEVSELGLFTNGDPGSGFSPGSRVTTLVAAASQAPNAYKTFEPVPKKDVFELIVSWQIRF